MSQLVRLEGKHTAQSTHCALFKQCYAHIAVVLTKTIQRHFDIDTDISWQFQHFKSWKWWKWHDIIRNSCAFYSTDPWNLFMSWSGHSTPVQWWMQARENWRFWRCVFCSCRDGENDLTHICATFPSFVCIFAPLTASLVASLFNPIIATPSPKPDRKVQRIIYLKVDILWV